MRERTKTRKKKKRRREREGATTKENYMYISKKGKRIVQNGEVMEQNKETQKDQPHKRKASKISN